MIFAKTKLCFQDVWKKYRPSPVELFCLVFGVLLVFWYAWLLDDAYVYFRYVDNLVIDKVGLVYNPGEFSEGFSSPLWAILLVLLRFLKLNYWFIVRGVGVASYIVFWFICIVINRKFVNNKDDLRCRINVPLIYLTFTYGVLCYFTSGLESPFVIVAAAVYAAVFLCPSNLLLQILLGLLPMIRHELIIPYAIAIPWLWHKNRRIPVTALLSCIITLGGYLVFRIWYYADLFPNTFYLKDEIWPLQGLKYLYDTVLPYFTVPYLLAAALAFFFLKHKNSNSNLHTNQRLMMLCAAVPVILYVIKIGGDPRHFRYLIFPYCLVILSTGGLVENIFRQSLQKYRFVPISAALIFALTIGLCYPRQLQQHPFFRHEFGYYHRGFFFIYDAAIHRLDSTGRTPKFYSSGTFLSYRSAEQRYRKNLDKKEILVEAACYDNYLDAGIPIIFSLGLTEPFLARTIMVSGRPAHKYGLIPLAEDIARVRSKYGFGVGVFEKAVNNGEKAPWIQENLSQIARIEQKAYNKHNFVDNLVLALSKTKKIDPQQKKSR